LEKKQQVEANDPMEDLKGRSQGDVRVGLARVPLGQQSLQRRQSVATLDSACSPAQKPWMWR